MHTLSNISNFAADLDFLSALKFIGFLAAAVLILSFIAKLLFGKNSGLNHALSSSLGILFIYAVTIVVYTFNPYDLSRFLAPLPFVSFDGDTLRIFEFAGAQMSVVCKEILSMIILAFLVNLLDGIMPTGEHLVSWYIWRTVTVIASMGLHYIVSWAFNTFLPGILVTYAPTILLWLLAAMLLMGFANLILSLLLTVVNPFFGAVYGFFFSNIIGKQISKAVITTLCLCAVVFALTHLGFGIISISAAALQAYIPLIAALLILWFAIGHV